MKFVINDSKKYYDDILSIYRAVLEDKTEKIELDISINKERTNILLLQDFLDLIHEIQHEFGFELIINVSTNIKEIEEAL